MPSHSLAEETLAEGNGCLRETQMLFMFAVSPHAGLLQSAEENKAPTKPRSSGNSKRNAHKLIDPTRVYLPVFITST